MTRRQPSEHERRDLAFAWRGVPSYVKSNAIVFARDEATVGVGAGQMSRVYSSRIGAIKAEDAGLAVRGAVMASDAFFPFRDGVEVAAAPGRHGGDPARRLDARCRSHRRRGRSRPGDAVHRHAAFPALNAQQQPAYKVLIIGSGGREHALAWKCAQSPRVTEVLVAPGNAGTAREPKVRNVAIGAERLEQAGGPCRQRRRERSPSSGPKCPLVAGIVDHFAMRGLPCFGPRKAPAQLEGSKAFTKEFLIRHGIPTAGYRTFTRDDLRPGVAGRAAGPHRGEGPRPGRRQGRDHRADRRPKPSRPPSPCCRAASASAGDEIVIEEFLEGEEASFIVICDGTHVLPMASSQDHKRLRDADEGPNTGGMGAYSPAPVVTPAVHDRIMREVIEPTVRGLAADGMPFTGFLYAGLMIDAAGAPKVIEYNVRFGDPETQPVLVAAQVRPHRAVRGGAGRQARHGEGRMGSALPRSAW